MGEDHNEPNGGAGTDPAVLRLASRALALTAGVLLFAMMLVATVDVVGRYGFASPLPGASEISQILLGLLIYFALPAVCLHQDHVIVGLVVERLAPGPRRVLGVLVNLLGGALLVVVAAQLHAHGALLASYSDVTVFLRIPTGPLAYVMAALSVVSACFLLFNSWAIATGRRSPSATPVAEGEAELSGPSSAR